MPKGDLKKLGLKVTLPRTRILQILEQNPSTHLSAEEIHHALHQKGEEISLATVYRVLTQFALAGLVQRRNFESGRSVFEINLGAGEHHDHLVCIQCGHVTEFEDQIIEKQQRVIAEHNGFKISDHDLTIYGTCKDCQK
jgi:Fur family transcriptional regulator, ferric uptake regulator